MPFNSTASFRRTPEPMLSLAFRRSMGSRLRGNDNLTEPHWRPRPPFF